MFSTLTSKGQLTLPAAIRRKLNLRPGDKLNCVAHDDGRIEMTLVNRSIRELRGILPRPAKPVSIAEMNDAIQKGSRG